MFVFQNIDFMLRRLKIDATDIRIRTTRTVSILLCCLISFESNQANYLFQPTMFVITCITNSVPFLKGYAQLMFLYTLVKSMFFVVGLVTTTVYHLELILSRKKTDEKRRK